MTWRPCHPDTPDRRSAHPWYLAGQAKTAADHWYRNSVACFVGLCHPSSVASVSGFALPDAQLAKAIVYMRALRRHIYGYWYATLEGREAAMIEAAAAAMTVNVLDEAIFQEAAGQAYCDHRAKDRFGRVVMGLELIRNCETHSPVIYDDLLVMTHMYSVPLNDGMNAFREVYRWAEYDDLPATYAEITTTASDRQKRARREAQGAYRDAVQRRVVLETLFDAINFFERVEPRLAVNDGSVPRWAYAEFTNRDVTTGEPIPMLARPIGMDAFSVFLPDIATRPTERRSAAWGPADAHFKDAVRVRKGGCLPPLARSCIACLTVTASSSGIAACRQESRTRSTHGLSGAIKYG